LVFRNTIRVRAGAGLREHLPTVLRPVPPLQFIKIEACAGLEALRVRANKHRT
jgi:hypothetical protein